MPHFSSMRPSRGGWKSRKRSSSSARPARRGCNRARWSIRSTSRGSGAWWRKGSLRPQSSQKNAAFLIDEAEQRGMEVSEAKFKLREARQARLQSRTMVHSVDEQRFRGVVEKGLVAAAVVAGDGRQAIDEYYFRRWGLGVATLIITIVGVSLYL